jgi:hypothetical protein
MSLRAISARSNRKRRDRACLSDERIMENTDRRSFFAALTSGAACATTVIIRHPLSDAQTRSGGEVNGVGEVDCQLTSARNGQGGHEGHGLISGDQTAVRQKEQTPVSSDRGRVRCGWCQDAWSGEPDGLQVRVLSTVLAEHLNVSRLVLQIQRWSEEVDRHVCNLNTVDAGQTNPIQTNVAAAKVARDAVCNFENREVTGEPGRM